MQFSSVDPTGRYRLDMRTPYSQMIARRLYELASTRMGCAFTKCAVPSKSVCGNQFSLGDDAAALAPSSGEEPAPPRYRAGVASMAWRSTQDSGRISTQEDEEEEKKDKKKEEDEDPIRERTGRVHVQAETRQKR